MENQQPEPTESTLRIATVAILIVPAIAALAATAAPDANLFYGSIMAIIVGLLFIYSIFQVVTKRYKQENPRLLQLIIFLNVSALFMLVSTWRVYGENLWLGLLLLALYIFVVSVAIVKREYFYNVMRHPRKYPVGGTIYGIVLLASAVIGPSSYGFAVAISSQQGDEVAMTVIFSMVAPFAYLFALVSIPAYVRIEENKLKSGGR